MHKQTILTDVVILTVTCGMMLFLQGCSRQDMPTLKSEETYLVEEYEDQVLAEDTNATNNTCYVYICGAVRNPGVYEMKPGERIFRAVELAGGFTDDAAPEKVNQALPVEDGLSIVVPNVSEARAESERASGLVDINTASKAELCTLKGIGETRADAIIAYRSEKGGFARIEDIMLVSGIGESSFNKFKDSIIVR